jgi:APA family basic amino acid/polyamine antiporter
LKTADSGAVLKKELKLRHFFVLGFGCIIGVGWIVYLGIWLAQAGPLGSILAFLAGGSLMMFIGLCYAELATMLPVSGGEIAYAYEIFGLKASFAVGWFLALSLVTYIAFEAISAGWIVDTLIPGFKGAVLYSNRGDPVHLGSLALGLGGVVFFTWLNYRGMRSAMRFQQALILGLVVFSLIFIGAGIFGGHTGNLEPFFPIEGAGSVIRSVLMVLITGPLWLGGFNIIPQVMEEKSEGASLKMVGKVILLAIGGAALFYLLVILSASMSSPWRSLLHVDLPAYGAFLAAFKSPFFAKTVLFAGLCGIISAWNTIFIASSRIIFALGRGRIIPSVFGRVHPRWKSPSVAVLFAGAVGFTGVFLGKNALVPIVNMGAFCFALAYLTSCLGVIKMRLRQPDRSRPYRMPGGIAVAVIGALVALGMLVYSLYLPFLNAKGAFPLEWAVILVWAVLGVLFWTAARKFRNQLSEEERRKLILGNAAGTRG